MAPILNAKLALFEQKKVVSKEVVSK